MATTIGEILTKATSRVQDEVERIGAPAVGAGNFKEAVSAALQRYSKDRPRTVVQRVQGDGTFKYQLDGSSPKLSAWSPEFSAVVSLVYPHSLTEQRPSAYDAENYSIIQDHLGLWLWFLSGSPSAAEYFLVAYTATHALTSSSSTSTVPAADDEALADLVAAFAFQKLAATYVQVADTSIQADVTDRRTRADVYLTLAGKYIKSYEQRMGIGAEAVVSAGIAFTDLNPPFSGGRGERLLFHD